MQQTSRHSSPAPAAANSAPFNRFIPWDEETRLLRIRDGLQGLHDLCVAQVGDNDIVRISHIGYLIELVLLDLQQVELGERDGQICHLGPAT